MKTITIFLTTMLLTATSQLFAQDVYVAGEANQVATVWKNGTVQNLTNGTYSAVSNSIFETSKIIKE